MISSFFNRNNAGTIKFHKICHWPAFIEEFGAPTNYNAETYETAHKWFVKRWIGCLPHGNAKSMMSLMRRNNIFLSHGGSNLLSKKRNIFRSPNAFDVSSQNADGTFEKLFLPRESAWVRRGMFVLYNGGTRGGNVARLIEFRRGPRVGVVQATVQKCRCVQTQSVLSAHTQGWSLDEGPASTIHFELKADSDYGIELYPMQCDFADASRFLFLPVHAHHLNYGCNLKIRSKKYICYVEFKLQRIHKKVLESFNGFKNSCGILPEGFIISKDS